jgi:hypothetical protein
MTTPAQPRHARAEIRAFAKWLRDRGWTYQRTDNLGHTIWAHPKASGHYKLPETPSHFSVKRARGDVERLLGIKHQGKRRGKSKASAPRRDFVLEQAQREARERSAQPRPAPATMTYPMRCVPCGHVHDAAKVTVVQRYTDCSVWRCPRCGSLIDDRPRGWGGSAERVNPAPPPARRVSRRLPWEDQPDDYDRGLARLMREIPGGR